MNIGIEVEWENVLEIPKLKSWYHADDGSLRNNGVEFIMKTPVCLDEIHNVLQELESVISRNSLEQSVRTSCHFHIDIRGKSNSFIKKLYYYG